MRNKTFYLFLFMGLLFLGLCDSHGRSLFMFGEDSTKTPAAVCDIAFWDMTASTVLPANKNEANLIVVQAMNKTSYSYRWYFGDGIMDTGRTVIHSYQQPGSYWVSLSVFDSANGSYCQDAQYILVKVGQAPGDSSNFPDCDATFSLRNHHPTTDSSSGNILVGLEAFRRGYSTYQWDFGDSTMGMGASISHAYKKEGNYRVQLLVKDTSDKGCIFKKQVLVTKDYIGLYDSLTSPIPSIACNPFIAHTSKGDTLIAWDDSPLYANPILFPDSIFIVVDSLRLDKPIYVGPSTFWKWDFGDGEEAIGSSIQHVFLLPGTYKVRVTKTIVHPTCPSCETFVYYPPITCVDSFTVSINTSPASALCEAPIRHSLTMNTLSVGTVVSTSSLNDTVTTVTWDWGDSTRSTGDTASHMYSKAGTYVVTCTKSVTKDPCLRFIGHCTQPVWLICEKKSPFDIYIDKDSISTVTGFEDIAIENENVVRFYPVPVQGILYLQIQNAQEPLSLQLFGSSGTLVHETSTVKLGVQEIDLRHLPNGMYMYTLTSSQGMVSKGKLTVAR
jgi:PKD repeat protein